MHVVITKDQLRELQANRGRLNLDNGELFERLVGRRHKEDGLYHCDLFFRDTAEGDVYDLFSLKKILDPPQEPPPLAMPDRSGNSTSEKVRQLQEDIAAHHDDDTPS